jgi:hypothetical protein
LIIDARAGQGSPRRRGCAARAHRFMYYPLRLIYEAIELGMHTAKNKPMTKKEREEKRKKRKEKQLAK